MKVAVLNFSGNVGKSTIAKYMLAPRNDSSLISVETINADEGGEQITAAQYDELQEILLSDAGVVVDVGASNIEEFVKQMTQYKHSHNDFDYFVIPVVKETKSQADTIGTVKALSAIGVPSKKIRILFNKVDINVNIDAEFSALLSFEEAEKKCVVRPGAAVCANGVYEKLKGLDVTIADLLAHPTDYKAEHKEAKSEGEKEKFMRLILAKRLAESAQENLDAAYKALFK